MNARAYDAASPLAQKLNQDHPTDPRPPYYLGVILREREAFENAERYLLESIKRDPKFARSHDALGILYGVQSRLKEALVAHHRAVELSPRDAQYWHNLGFALTLSKRYDESIKAYQKALAAAPEKKRIYQSLGVVYAVKGDDDGARRMLMQALTPSQAWLQLAALQERRGDLETAQESLHRALSLTPDSPQAQASLNRVRDALKARATSPRREAPQVSGALDLTPQPPLAPTPPRGVAAPKRRVKSK